VRVALAGEDWLGVARVTFRAGLVDGLGDEPVDGLGLAFEGLKFELGAGLDDRKDPLLLVVGVVAAGVLAIAVELVPVVRLDVFFVGCDEADADAGGHACCEQGIMGLVLTPWLAVSRIMTTAIAATRTVGKMTAHK